MIKKTIHRLLRHRHFWRDVGFDELSELYTSMLLRTLAVSMLMVFVPFYLYQNNYSVQLIFLLYGFFFAGKIVSDIGAGYYVARFGPKHTMIVSCLLQIISSGMFLSVPGMHWPVWLLGIVWGASASFFFIAYHVVFSKIKHTDHAGKEIGYMSIMEKSGLTIGPLVGGIVGTIFGAQYIFLVATIVMFASLWPLFQSAEPVHTHQKLRFRELPVVRIKYDLISYCSMSIENSLCINLWPLYLSLFALGSSVYAKLGVLTSVSVLASVLSAVAIGKYIDQKSGRRILRIAAVVNSFVYLLRPFVGSVGSAFAVTVLNDAVTVGYRMPYHKGMYAAADDFPGFRIVYIVSMEAMGDIAKATAWFMLSILLGVISERTAIMVGFAVAAIASLMIMSERFKALRTKDIMQS